MASFGRRRSSQAGKSPGSPAKQLEHRGEQQATHDERVEEHGGGEAEAEQLQYAFVAQRERREHADHDRGRGSDHPAGRRQSARDGTGGVVARPHSSWMRETRNTS